MAQECVGDLLSPSPTHARNTDAYPVQCAGPAKN